jgi:hypothetical protein
VELVDEAELPRWAGDFARHHPRVGTPTLLVWMPPDQLAKQFTGLPSRRRRGWLRSPPFRTIGAVRAHGSASSRDGSRSVRVGHGGAHHRFDADGVTLRHPLLVMVDGSVLPRILDRYSGRVGLMWNVYEVTGDTCP